jgi:hypothetical protein
LCQSAREVSSPFLKRAIEDIIPNEQAAIFVRREFIDIAIFEVALGKRQLLSFVVDEERAIHEFASIKTRNNYLASKIEKLGPKALAVYDTLFRGPVRCHFFAFGLSFYKPVILHSVRAGDQHEATAVSVSSIWTLPPISIL